MIVCGQVQLFDAHEDAHQRRKKGELRQLGHEVEPEK